MPTCRQASPRRFSPSSRTGCPRALRQPDRAALQGSQRNIGINAFLDDDVDMHPEPRSPPSSLQRMPLAKSEAIVAAALITAPATNTIALVHRRQLMDHRLARLATFLDLPASGIGRIGGGWMRRPSSGIGLRSACEIAGDRDGPDLAFRRESRFPGAGTRLPARADGQQLPPPSNKERIARSGASRRSARTAACPASGAGRPTCFRSRPGQPDLQRKPAG